MEFGPKELTIINHYLTRCLREDREKLIMMDEDSDEHMELANDLMVVEAIIDRIRQSRR